MHGGAARLCFFCSRAGVGARRATPLAAAHARHSGNARDTNLSGRSIGDEQRCHQKQRQRGSAARARRHRKKGVGW